ncbi:MAG: hypothetical protein LWX11_10475 [Firmicutes bacterium]|nr:hypothetical protein [Bacillota bacterium]
MIPLETQTLFAELLERLMGLEFQRTFGELSGSFGKKTKDGKDHWYFRTSEGAQGRSEFYLGADDEKTRRRMAEYSSLKRESEEIAGALNRMASMLMLGGCAATDHATAKVIRALASSGLFRQGGVLVGTHAFVAMGNLLGVRWRGASRTQDIDVASFRTLEVALPPMEEGVWSTLESLNMGFLPTPGLNPKHFSTSYSIRGQKLRVDLLTTASRRGPFSPVFLPRFKAAALPMLFMDYLLEQPVEAMVINGGATLVRIPRPAHFGFHKLLVSDERPVTEQAKARKDMEQAFEVLEYLLEIRPADVELAFDRLIAKKLHQRVVNKIKSSFSNGTALVGFIQNRMRKS